MGDAVWNLELVHAESDGAITVILSVDRKYRIGYIAS